MNRGAEGPKKFRSDLTNDGLLMYEFQHAPVDLEDIPCVIGFIEWFRNSWSTYIEANQVIPYPILIVLDNIDISLPIFSNSF